MHTPWPLPDFHFNLDETWGEDRTTTVRRLTLVGELRAELQKPSNWSAQLAQAGDAFATFAKLPPPADADAPQPLIAHPNALLQFVQKRLPLAKQLDKLGSDGIDGERTIAIDKLLFGAIEKAPDKTLSDNFPAAQFFEMSEDDKLGKPSFDRFTSGLESGQKVYQFEQPIAEVFDYEEVNLSLEKSGVGALAMASLTLAAHRNWALELGAAGRSALRIKDQMRPEETAKVVVNPPPLKTLDTAAGTLTGTALAGAAASSFWHAQDSAKAQGAAVQVVEAFETAF